MPSTPTLLLPYPAPADPADVPADMAELATALDTIVLPNSQKGVANGVASLDATGKVPAAQLPAASAGTGQELAFQQYTAAVTINQTAEASAVTVVTAPATTFDGTTVIVQFSAPYVQAPAVAGAIIYIVLFQDGASMGFMGGIINPAAAAISVPANMTQRITPAAGSHTYSIRSFASSATGGQVGAGAGGAAAYRPGYIRITKA